MPSRIGWQTFLTIQVSYCTVFNFKSLTQCQIRPRLHLLPPLALQLCRRQAKVHHQQGQIMWLWNKVMHPKQLRALQQPTSTPIVSWFTQCQVLSLCCWCVDWNCVRWQSTGARSNFHFTHHIHPCMELMRSHGKSLLLIDCGGHHSAWLRHSWRLCAKLLSSAWLHRVRHRNCGSV